MSDRATTVLMFLLGASVTGVIALGVILLTGGDDDSPATTAAAVTTIDTTATTSATATTVTTTAPTTTTTVTTAAPPCIGAALGPLSGIVSSQSGDFDGDGAMDTLYGYQTAGTSRIRMTLSYGYSVEITVPGPAQALAAQSFAGDPRWLGIATHDAGASTQVFGFYLLDGCDLRLATIDDGVGTWEATFLLGGGVMHLDGMVCSSDGMTARSAATGDGTSWEYFTYDYVWSPEDRMFLTAGAASSTLTYPADEDAIFGAAEFGCPFGS